MNRPPSFKGHKHTPETKARLAAITAERNRRLWADPNSGFRKRRDIWIARRANGNASGSLLGKTYEEIHGIEEAERLVELRKQSCYWEYVTNEQRAANSLKAWDSPERAKKTAEAQHRKPSKPEVLFTERLESEFPNTWKYVGDGDIWIARLNPDFININGQKLLIETYTPYFKLMTYGTIEAFIEQRGSHFLKYGFRTLFLNLEEDWDSLIEEVRHFAKEEEKKCTPNG